MKCTFDIKYHCQNCGQEHSTYIQYEHELDEHELDSPPKAWEQYDDGRQHPQVASIVGKTFICKEDNEFSTKIKDVEELIVWPCS